MTRSVFRISGSDSHSFLQGLVTNDVDRLRDGIVYTAMLTPQGKYLADFFLAPDQDTILLDVDAGLAAMLQQRLSMYKLRADVRIEAINFGVERGTGPAPQGSFADPRHPHLGWRRYTNDSIEASDEAAFDTIRVQHCIPQTGIELTEDTFILEAGFERLNGVDFRKGCYVGQEVTARMKHKTELRKGLVTVNIEGYAPVGTQINAGGKAAGTIYTQAEGLAIAYLRFDRAQNTMQADNAKVSYQPEPRP